MNEDRLLREIERYYGSRSAPPETVQFLSELARRGAAGTFDARRVPLARRVVALAACVAALVGASAIGYRIGLRNSVPDMGPTAGIPLAAAKQVTSSSPKSVAPDDTDTSEAEAHRGMEVVATIPPIEGEDDAPPTTSGASRLLLMRVYAEWCPRSPKLAPAYEQLVERYKREPLLIVSFDVTDSAKRRQAGYMAQSLGVLKLLGHKWEPSTILLIDREKGEIVKLIRDVEDRPLIEHALAQALPHGNPSLRQP